MSLAHDLAFMKSELPIVLEWWWMGYKILNRMISMSRYNNFSSKKLKPLFSYCNNYLGTKPHSFVDSSDSPTYYQVYS